MRDVEWLPQERRRQKIFDLYLVAVQASMKGGASEWWRHAVGYDETSDPVQVMPQLKDFCIRQLLHETGDLRSFLRIYGVLAEEGFLEGDVRGHFLLELVRYLVDALEAADRAAAERRKSPFMRYVASIAGGAREYDWLGRRLPALLGVVLFDGPSTENFFEFGVSSLNGDDLKALCRKRAVALHVFHREHDLAGLQARFDGYALPCDIVYRPIPEDLARRAEGVPGPETEWLLGALQCLLLLEARRQRADFHGINPNGLYGTGYFDGLSRLRRRGVDAVLLASVYAMKQQVREHLAPFWRNKSLVVPPAELMGIGLHGREPVDGLKVIRDNGYFGGPMAHFQLALEQENGVELHSTQHEIAFLSYRALERMPDRFFMKPSTDVDRMLPAASQPHFAGRDDGLAIVDLGNHKDVKSEADIDFADFTEGMLDSLRPRQADYFRQPVSLPVVRAQPAPWQVRPELATRMASIFEPLAKMASAPKAGQALTALSTLHQLEMSDYGIDDMASVIAEGRRILAMARSADVALDDAQRRDLIRAALNFDSFEDAVALARSGGAGTAFIDDFLSLTSSLRTVNEAHAKRMLVTFRRRHVSVVGTIVWGESFVDKFMNYCLPSLLAPGNIPALAKKGSAVVSIVTTEADRDRMITHPAFARLKEVAEPVFTCFPAEFLRRREEDGYNFYFFYGLLDHQNIFLAKALAADLYLLPIDCVYSSETLANFSAYLTDWDGASIGALECDEASMKAWLDAKPGRRPDVLEVSGEALIEGAAERPDRYFRSMVMNPDNIQFCAHPRELVWPFADGMAIHSVYMHPLSVSARMLARPFHLHHENVDYATLPRLLQGDGRLKIIEDGREATLAHFGAPPTRNAYLEGGFSIKSFIEAHRYDYAVHRRFFPHRQFFPCARVPYAPSTAYAEEVALIQGALRRNGI
ncbi:hypothetical protein [Reyranella sp.]|uniref:hypothetical protein n=1 Tax=Reyranella sp. TaxID=1929291 RepID=UPI003BA9F5AA